MRVIERACSLKVYYPCSVYQALFLRVRPLFAKNTALGTRLGWFSLAHWLTDSVIDSLTCHPHSLSHTHSLSLYHTDSVIDSLTCHPHSLSLTHTHSLSLYITLTHLLTCSLAQSLNNFFSNTHRQLQEKVSALEQSLTLMVREFEKEKEDMATRHTQQIHSSQTELDTIKRQNELQQRESAHMRKLARPENRAGTILS